MTIHLPENLESSILEVVHSGQFASLDDAMAEAARLLLRKVKQAQPPAIATPVNGQENAAAAAYKPIWEVADDIRKTVPAEEWARLPKDGASQLDHYIYGTPKRSTT